VTGPRDWDKELAKIDRVIEGTPPARPPATAGSPGAPAAPRGPARSVWGRLLPVLALAAALPFWPYARGCGTALLLYLGATAVLVCAGGWAAVSAWRHRRAAAHVLALGAMLWGGVLAAREVLPRVGYARIAISWSC
jgi:hypothetical protein